MNFISFRSVAVGLFPNQIIGHWYGRHGSALKELVSIARSFECRNYLRNVQKGNALVQSKCVTIDSDIEIIPYSFY